MDAFPQFPMGFTSLLSPVREHFKETCEVAAGKEQTKQNSNDYVYRKDRVIPGVRFIPDMLHISPGFKRLHHCQKVLS